MSYHIAEKKQFPTFQIPSSITHRTEGCFRNCVERFLDTNILVTNRLDKKADELLAKHDQLGQ